MHTDELWQEFDAQGERSKGVGYDASLGNPLRGGGDIYVGAAAVWLYRRTEHGLEVLFQQRSPKISNGGKWDISAGGHINRGEREVDAAVRELAEEIGAKAQPEELEFMFKLKTFFNVQMYVFHYLCDWTGKDDEFVFDDGEVSAVKWVPFSELDEFIDGCVKDPIKNAKFTRELTKFWLSKKDGNL